MFSILEGRKACMLFKFPEKVPQIIKAAVQADLHNRGVSGLKEGDRLFDTVLINIGTR